MSDDVTVDNGSGTDYSVSTEELSDLSHLQSVELHTESAGTKTKVGSGNGLHVQGTVSVSGVATLAEQQTQTTALSAIKTSVETLDNAIAGSEMQVDVVTLPTLPSGTNNIGDVDILSIAAGNNNIGDVDVASVPTDPFGANADAASATGSISAKLKFIASTGIPITGTVTVGSHAVTNTVLSVVGTGTEAAAQRVTIATDSTGVLSVDDNGSSLSIDDGGNVITVDGTVAVTNADMTGAATSLAIIDDWDESDRAKVNPIVGQAGIAAGTGVDGVTVPRVTLATNVALPAGTNAIGKLSANSGVDIGDVDVTSVPTDPFGVNADAASATGSISAKLRFIASTGIPVTGTVTVGTHAVTNAAGSFVVQENGAALTALQLIDNTIFVDDVAFTPAASSVSAIGMLADQTATDSVDEGDIGIPRMTLTRQAITTLAPSATTEGLSKFKSIDIDETEEEVKGSAGKLYSFTAHNLASATRYIKVYNNTAAGVTVGTTVPDWTIPLAAGQGIVWADPNGMAMGTGITFAATTGIADADTGAPGANECVINVAYI